MDDALGWKLRFFTIWTGQTLSLAGSALVQFALVWWLTETTGSATVLATASVAALLPGSLLGPFAGALVDRWPRRWIIVVADGAIAALTALLVILYAQGVVEVWHLYVVLALRALGTAFHDPAMTASTPLMVPKDHLTRVAGMNQTRASITNLGGPVLGALLVAYLPMHGVLAIDIATAAVAILPLLFIDIPQSLPTVTPGGQRQRSVFAETVEGFRYLWSWRGLFVVVATSSVVMFFHQPSVAFTPLMIQQHFGGGPAEWALNSAVFNAGMLAGGLLMSTWGGIQAACDQHAHRALCDGSGLSGARGSSTQRVLAFPRRRASLWCDRAGLHRCPTGDHAVHDTQRTAGASLCGAA